MKHDTVCPLCQGSGTTEWPWWRDINVDTLIEDYKHICFMHDRGFMSTEAFNEYCMLLLEAFMKDNCDVFIRLAQM